MTLSPTSLSFDMVRVRGGRVSQPVRQRCKQTPRPASR
ncbi:hypothetical protein SUBG_00076 [Sulfitobacter phage pCB2047-C]|nr:hypothetical protein SUBG_00076 [Sulfitobacter phage pCB2047-C]YP_009046890.1 hypothetical protein SUAG_00075 [Sulfitobacter phage pCB2047-A]AGG91197.2 hypothetical protein SUBG_00076 [Sulfitobacter phage pCB2047-C]AIE48235.1 hypothetical protein SUAG_00075 [Sulfitobacter phage pCB2047-A]